MESALLNKKIFIVEDAPCVRARLIDLLGSISGLLIAGEAETPSDAISGIFLSNPKCVVLDFQLQGGTGIDVLNAVSKKMPQIIFIILSNHTHPMYKKMCTEAGAHYFFDKSTDFIKVKEAIARYMV